MRRRRGPRRRLSIWNYYPYAEFSVTFTYLIYLLLVHNIYSSAIEKHVRTKNVLLQGLKCYKDTHAYDVTQVTHQ